MIGPYWMVAVNIIVSGILFGGFFTYKYIFPKKNINLLIALVLISILPLISLLRIGTYESGDLSINVVKTMSFYSALLEGNLFPQWAESLNATYGYPLFIFTYPLPYYIVSFFHSLSFSYIDSIKLLLFFSYILSGIAMYFWIKGIFGKISAFISALFYLFFPYHLIDMHFRVDIGESLSFIFLPLTLLFARKIILDKKMGWVILEGFSIAGLILSHQAVSISFIPFILIYGLFEFYNKRKNDIYDLIRIVWALVLGFALSAFYWIPAVIEGIYTKRAEYSTILSFVNPLELIYSPWRFGLLFQGPKGELSFLVGYAQWLVIIFLVLFLFRKRIKNLYQKRFSILFFSMFVFVLIMMLPVSSFIWDVVPLIKNFQFTYRLLAIEALFTSALAGVLVKNINMKFFIYFLCLFVIFTTILNWGNRKTIPQITDNILKQNLPLSTVEGEGLQPAALIWVNSEQPWIDTTPKQHLEVISGNVVVKQDFRNSTFHKYTVSVKSDSSLKENTLYFPGWNIYANGKNLNINYQNHKYPGVMTFELTKGNYKIEVVFRDTPIVFLGKLITVIAMLGLIVVLFVKLISSKASGKHQPFFPKFEF